MNIKNIIKFLNDNNVDFVVPGCYNLPKKIVVEALNEFEEKGESNLIRKHRDWNYLEWDFYELRKGRYIWTEMSLKDLKKLKSLKNFWLDYNNIDILEKYIKEAKTKEKIQKQYKYKRKKGFTLKLKNECKKRDNYKCVKCGNNENLEIDHIVPLIKDGYNLLDNLQTLCKECHKIKTKKDLK